MLAQLNAANRGHALRVVPLLAAAEQLPLRAASLDVVTAFNCVHHFDLGRFLTAAARVLKPGGQLFIYTRTPQQNARTIWGQYFPGFTEHEQRLHTHAATPGRRQPNRRAHHGHGPDLPAIRAPAQPGGSRPRPKDATTQPSPSTPPKSCARSIAAFLARLPSAEVRWVDEHLLIVAGASHHNQAEPHGPGSETSQAI